MEKCTIYHLFPIFFCLLFSHAVFATIITSNDDASWLESTTWDLGRVPLPTDTVRINGHSITLTGGDSITIKRLEITNTANRVTKLTINSTTILTVTGDLISTAEDYSVNVELILTDTSSLHVNGNVTFLRTADNNKSEKFQLNLTDTSAMYVTGNFTYLYYNSAGSETYSEIKLEDKAYLNVKGTTVMTQSGGDNFKVKLIGSSQMVLDDTLNVSSSGGNNLRIISDSSSHLLMNGVASITNSGGTGFIKFIAGQTEGGKFTFNDDVSLTSTATGKKSRVEANFANSTVNILGDVTMSAVGAGDVAIDLLSNSKLTMAGNFLRPSNFGALAMAPATTIELTGGANQTIAPSKLPGSGTDSLYYANLIVNNTSGDPITLTGDFVVYDSLALTDGIINTSDTAMLIIEDGAAIGEGNENSFINGPMVKRGSTNGSSFKFPLGEGTNYGPLEISQVTSSSSEYKAQYFSCPPPFGTHLAPGVAQVSSNEYWTLTRTLTSDPVNVTLHWTDAAASGITDTDALIVSYYNETLGWINGGIGLVTGGTGVGESGSISNLLSCPPPFGSEKFTFGTISELMPLPVELTGFIARQNGQHVLLEWETSSENNSSHFVVEKSTDGKFFDQLAVVEAQGFSIQTSYYRAKDISPVDDKNYYRLNQVDIDGMNEYSEIVVVTMKSSKNQLLLFPNPVKDYIQLNSDDPRSLDTKIDIFDQMGQLLYSGVHTMVNGKIRFPTSQVRMAETANYFMVLQNENGIKSLQFVKIN